MIPVSFLSIPPIGSIIAWVSKANKSSNSFVELPDGWVKCDGSLIPKGSMWEGFYTPNLNGERLFIRGGLDEEVLEMEEDIAKLPDHVHIDNGHSHTIDDHQHNIEDHKHHIDKHTHTIPDHYHDIDPHDHTTMPHSHSYVRKNNKKNSCPMASGRYWCFTDEERFTRSATVRVNSKRLTTRHSRIEAHEASLNSSHARLTMDSVRLSANNEKSGVGTVENLKDIAAEETRPKNMKVIFIMRVW